MNLAWCSLLCYVLYFMKLLIGGDLKVDVHRKESSSSSSSSRSSSSILSGWKTTLPTNLRTSVSAGTDEKESEEIGKLKLLTSNILPNKLIPHV